LKRKQILLNAVTTLIQVIGSAATLFFLYRFLIRAIGVQRLGIWSLVLATTSVVTLANQGFATSVVKFVAKYAALGRAEDLSVLVQTAIISVGLTLAVLSFALYPGAIWILKVVVPPAHVNEALVILPYAFISLWVNIIGGILLAALTGCELITRKNYILLTSAVLYLFLCFVLVPAHGLLGLAYAQTAQTGICFAFTWVALHPAIPHLPLFPHRWDRAFFREMFSYGATFQSITVSQALREPVTKALLTKFGGLALTGFYDMASRWVFTFREGIVQANLVLVPTVSSLKERDPRSISAVYRESYRLIFFLAIPTFSFLVVVSPLVSQIWLGHYEPIFVGFVTLLGIAWLVNVLSNPAYVVDLGTGNLRWVFIGCVVTATLNLGLGFFAGRYFGGTAVVAASTFSLAIGYVVILLSYHVQNNVPFSQLLPRDSIFIVLCSLLGVLLFLPWLSHAPLKSPFSLRLMSEVTAALFTMIVAPMWLHPMRKRLLNWVSSLLPA
jgi:O-antigen/teichoic acid export membrane protein